MPKKVPDYTKSSIYKIVHKEDFNNENIYIGSTTNFIQRKKSHKKTCNKENDKDYNLKLYQYIRENGGWNDWTMIQIQPYSCNSKKELETEERRFIEQLKAKLNNNIPTTTQVEYHYDNREKILEKQKEYYYDNKDKIVEKNKKWYNDNKEIIAQKSKEYRNKNKDKIKQYQNHNKEKIAKQKKEKYEANKEKILEKLAIKINCDNCGCEITKTYLEKHKRTQKCINFNSK